MAYVYVVVALISFIVLCLFIAISDRKVLFYNASFFIFVLIGNMGYMTLGFSDNLKEAVLAYKLTYLCGCLLSLFLMMLVFDACKVMPNKPIRLGMYGLSFTVILLSMSIGYTDWFYKDCHIEKIYGTTVLIKEYGPWHNLFLAMMYGYVLLGVILIIYSLWKRKNLVYKNVIMLLVVFSITIFCYTVGRKLFVAIDPLCISYCINDIILLFVTYNTCLYNLDEALLNSVEKQENQGYLLFDKRFNYVGSNHVAVKFIPALKSQRLAKKLDTTQSEVLAIVDEMIKNYSKESERQTISVEGQDIEISVQYLYKSSKVRGYIVRLADDSKRQEYIRRLDMISMNKSHFLSNVSHEIRTPINSVLGMNEMILRECKEDNIREYALNIASSGETLLQLINDVLDLSKIESGKLEVIPKEYNLADIIYELESIIQPLVNKTPLKLIIETSPNLPKTLYGDAIRVKQMVTNILTNAVKYTEEGSVVFDISGERQGDTFLFRYQVKDTGKGIKKSDMEYLFDSFERVDQLKNSGIEGTGLGLAITKKFATMMGGNIEVESTYGEGSIFTITVPQKIVGEELMGDYRTNRQENVHQKYTESFHAPDAHILVVDDVKMNLTVIKLLLKETNLQVTCCSSGKECLEAVKENSFDVIFLDHMMPELDGVETLKIIRENHYCDETPIIVLTANADVNAKEQYLEAGFKDYLSKPVDPRLLEQCLLNCLPKDKLRDI